MKKFRFSFSMMIFIFAIFTVYGQESLTIEPWPSEMTIEEIAAGYPRIGIDFSTLDDRVRSLPKADGIEATIAQLTPLVEDDWEKVRAVYIWLTENIAYDAAAFFSGRSAASRPEEVFVSGKSVCQGYSELFVFLAEGLGLKAVLVSGYAKGYGYRSGSSFSGTNHAWNAVFIQGRWQLFDSTWGAGSVDGRTFVRQYDEFWFDPHPALFLKTHLPAVDEWQLIETPITKGEFVRMPYVESYTFENLSSLGVDDFRILEALENSDALADFFSFEGHEIEILQAPLVQKLTAGEPVTVSIRAPGVDLGTFLMNGQFNDFRAEDGVLSGTFTPVNGTLKISLLMNYKNQESYWTVIKYQVR